MQKSEEFFNRRDRLVERRSLLDLLKPDKKTDKLLVGIDGTTAFALGKTIGAVLEL